MPRRLRPTFDLQRQSPLLPICLGGDQNFFDLCWIDILTARNIHVLYAIYHIDITVFIAPPNVARLKPAIVGKRCLGGGFIKEISWRYRWAAELDFACARLPSGVSARRICVMD